MVYTVYLDEMLLGNILMNSVILWLTARFCLFYIPTWRIVMAAIFGAVYAVALIFPVPAYLTGIPAKITVSFIMLLVALLPLPARKLVSSVVVFYLASFGLGGLVFGLSYLLGGNGFVTATHGFLELPRHHFWPVVASALVVALLVGSIGAGFWRRRLARSVFHVPVRIYLYGQHRSLNALVDTGNQLADPLTNQPVIVVELEAIQDLMPLELRRAMTAEAEPDFEKLLSSLADRKWVTRLRLIPFQSLGRSHGLLLGFRPDRVEIVYGREVVRVTDVVVAVYQRRLCADAAYRALVNPRLLDTAAGF